MRGDQRGERKGWRIEQKKGEGKEVVSPRELISRVKKKQKSCFLLVEKEQRKSKEIAKKIKEKEGNKELLLRGRVSKKGDHPKASLLDFPFFFFYPWFQFASRFIHEHCNYSFDILH